VFHHTAQKITILSYRFSRNSKESRRKSQSNIERLRRGANDRKIWLQRNEHNQSCTTRSEKINFTGAHGNRTEQGGREKKNGAGGTK
jgi:hypothetical protein